MTQIKVDTIADAAGTGATDFADGITIAGGALSALNTAEYYSSASEPTSPKNGAIWWDTTNEKVMVYIADEFKEVELGASAGGGWTVDLSNVTYDSVSFSVAGQATSPRSLSFNADGTKMYIINNANDTIYQYTLSTAFNLSTASYDSVSLSVAAQESNPLRKTFNSDGTKMYVIGSSSDAVLQYSLSTGFDLSTASYSNTSFSVSGQSTTPVGLSFNADGTKMYILAATGVYQYSLSTGFSLNTASYDNVSFPVATQDNNPQDFAFNGDGTKLYVMGYTSDSVYQYSLSTGFDLSTASYDSTSFNLSTQDTMPTSIAFNNDGTKLYSVGSQNDSVYQYSTGV